MRESYSFHITLFMSTQIRSYETTDQLSRLGLEIKNPAVRRGWELWQLTQHAITLPAPLRRVDEGSPSSRRLRRVRSPMT